MTIFYAAYENSTGDLLLYGATDWETNGGTAFDVDTMTQRTDCPDPGKCKGVPQDDNKMSRYDNDDTGTSTSIAVTVLTDTGKVWTVDEWVGKDLIITSGAAQWKSYPIVSNTATTLTITGDLIADGVVATDTYAIKGTWIEVDQP